MRTMELESVMAKAPRALFILFVAPQNLVGAPKRRLAIAPPLFASSIYGPSLRPSTRPTVPLPKPSVLYRGAGGCTPLKLRPISTGTFPMSSPPDEFDNGDTDFGSDAK